MRTLSRSLFVAVVAALILAVSAPVAMAAPSVIASDEFTSGPLNTNMWKTVLPWGTQYNSNHEQEWYNPGNLSFPSGGLRITTLKQSMNGYPYTSGVVTSKSQYSYGYFEFRAKLPKGQGIWPALWLLNDGTQEVDLMELLGNQPNKIYMTYHRGGSQVYQAQYTGPDFSAGYHTFAADVQPSYIRWYVDGVLRGQYNGSIAPNTGNIVVNTAVGGTGSWPGTPNSSTVFPQYLDLDYVRVYSSMPAPGTAPAPAPTWPSSVAYSRIAGSDRYATAVAVSQKAFPNGAPAAVIAYGGNYPDALAAAPLAKAYGGPVLLTPTDGFGSAVQNELKRLSPKQVFIVGSTGVVGGNVEAQLRGLPSAPSVTRLAGADRYGTAARIADALTAKIGKPARIVLANGYADALSISPLAAAKGWPILLTTQGSLPAATADEISSLGVQSSLVIGSPLAISDSVMGRLPAPTRLGGADRYATCAAVADYSVSQGSSYAHFALATGTNVPDGLVAAPYLGIYSGLLMLTDQNDLPSQLAQRISANKAAVTTVNAIGSTSCLSDWIVDAAANALK